MEKRIVRVLKAVAELHDMSLGDLLEGVVLHAFEGKAAFSPESTGVTRSTALVTSTFSVVDPSFRTTFTFLFSAPVNCRSVSS